MELAGDFLRACHGGQWFSVSMVQCMLLIVAVDELCLMLCPDRDTLLGVSVKYLWVQGFSGSMFQWVQTRSRRPSRDRG